MASISAVHCVSMIKKTWWLTVLAALSGTASASQEQDPTAPLNWTKKEQVGKVKRAIPVPDLQSIVCNNKDQCYAILNDKVVDKGDTVSGYRVTNVTSSQVELKQGQKSWTLKLFSLDIKK